MSTQDDEKSTRIFACSQCPKIFATRSNLKRHMENPNIHNIPYVRSRDQKRWRGHSKKVISKEETTESNTDRMRKWRAENREKNRQNDLRCRVYRLARQRYGDVNSVEKQIFIREEIARRLGRRISIEKKTTDSWRTPQQTKPYTRTRRSNTMDICSSILSSEPSTITMDTELEELPFYSAPQHKIELPSLGQFKPNDCSWSSPTSSPTLVPVLSPSLERRISSSSSSSSINSEPTDSQINSPTMSKQDSYHGESGDANKSDGYVLPSMHTFLPYASTSAVISVEQQQQQRSCVPTVSTKGGIKYVESSRILDEFAGVVLNYVDNAATQ
ncbi:MAG: hypothetical protein EXX96DRAFT_609639 [Benjaminiella poitrasii]|nr:MAG: hypothetical protein EXX96DRAFT_609639 [Benjaminiella poitrasii]